MTSMRAIKLTEVGVVREVEVNRPQLGHGEVLIEVAAAGVCQTDVSVRSADRAIVPVGTTLGHEIAGVVVEVSDDVEGRSVGDPVVVYPVWACGVCSMCIEGRQNACRGTGGRLRVPSAPGMSHDGGMAELVAVPARWTVSALGVDPELAAVLPDAGLVPYHTIRTQLELLRPGSTAVVVGVGGLGQFAVAILRALTPARIIAVDTSPRSLEAVAGRVDLAVNATDPDAIAHILCATGGYGAELVLDFVGVDATLALDVGVVAPYGAIRVPGLGGGVYEFKTAKQSRGLPFGATLARSYSGTLRDLVELVELARAGRLDVDLVRYSFGDAMQAFDDLARGDVRGRAVLIR
ncbi:alcohol dehydrogenase catalytic domain-containing protein [Gordonia polyisoprenivorans]|uniref:alcohol dehydrogenase catalytic domain-containing protein n=1 Tax=Gordonia polyisoprenivorans TaxID=84595 RepID=UPI001AD7564C|nr:alcohol dehydrogenase catalytic domain-containing protein [Gordonia polyisoprenivorans]QTI69904.1 alcohol dehydrogenase catalytic domain-containing protein [Gordonia polyisoprenivorans]